MLLSVTLMDLFINFIIENWKVLAILFFTFLTFLLQLIFKKRSVVVDDSATFRICKFVDSAEKLFGSGQGDKKLQYVLNCLNDEEGIYKPMIEWILALPKKKN